MLVINIIAALMGIAAAGACAVLAGRPAGVGKNGTAFVFLPNLLNLMFSLKKKMQTFKKRCRSSELTDVSPKIIIAL